MALTVALTMTITGVGCGNNNQQDSSAPETQESVESVAEISYANVNFDFAE